MIVTVGGIKGGSGKTTTATNLAVMRRRAGRDVLLLDADEQGSAAEFAAQREALGHGVIPCVRLTGKEVAAQGRDLARRYDDIVIDAGGRDTRGQRAALLISDLVVLPFAPGNYDLWTAEQVAQLIGEAKATNPRLLALAFINRGHASGTDNRDAAEQLAEIEGIQTLPVTLGYRKAFNLASGQGLAVVELP